MSNLPDLRFDVDALFHFLSQDLDYDFTQEREWHFSFRSNSLDALQELASDLEDEFSVQVQESADEVNADGTIRPGDPLLTVIVQGALSADDIKQIVQRLRGIADPRGLVYEGVDCYDPIDEDELLGWILPEDAGWRLRLMTDCGLSENAELPWTFLIGAAELETIKKIGDGLKALGLEDYDVYDEPDDEGEYGLCLFVRGRNNEPELIDMSNKVAQLAEKLGGHVDGIQFYDREELIDVFGINDED